MQSDKLDRKQTMTERKKAQFPVFFNIYTFLLISPKCLAYRGEPGHSQKKTYD